MASTAENVDGVSAPPVVATGEHASSNAMTSQPPAEKSDKTDQQPMDEKATDNAAEPKKDESEQKDAKKDDGDEKKEEKSPAGGFDATPIPRKESGYTLKITIHRAENLPMADINTLSSDPYVETQIYTANPQRHKEDPPLKMRTFTIRKDTDPVWNAEWIVANVPVSGFKLKCRLYDEDPADHDDRLGNAHIEELQINDNWKGFTERSFKIKKRMGSKRAYLAQAVATAVRKRKHMNGHLIVSIENLGKTESENGSRVYTVGPMWWIKHYSPLLGRIVGKKTPSDDGHGNDVEATKTERYNFQANQFQFHGPVPAALYHRYVEFRPFVKRMFTHSGIRGFFLHKAMVHQHNQIYHFDRNTEWGYMPDGPNKDCSLKFLELCHFDKGGRIFTYIITLDGLMRFTETGKEFGIDMLSKHTMHSKVDLYIAFSGEFFIRRLKKRHEPPPEVGGNNESHPPKDLDNGPPGDDPPKDPAYYEVVIDNDSGTYRPNADLLPTLKEYLHYNLPGLKVVTLDCQKDEELQQALKDEQRKKKEEEGDIIIFRQTSRDSSISSSDESDLEDMIQRGRADPSFVKTLKHDLSTRRNLKKQHMKSLVKGRENITSTSPNGHATGSDKPTVAQEMTAEPDTNGSAEKEQLTNGASEKKVETNGNAVHTPAAIAA